jgi:hypothetical protein
MPMHRRYYYLAFSEGENGIRERKNEKKYAWVRGCEAPDGDRQFLMPLLGFSDFERRAECISTDGSYIYLTPLAPARDRLIATGDRVFPPTQVITMLSLVLYELGTNAMK